MANYMLVNGTQLDADLKSVADSIRAKAGLTSTEKLDFPEEFKTVVAGISTGVNVQITSGKVTTNYAGTASANLGFKPDFVAFDGGTVPAGVGAGTKIFVAAALTAGGITKGYVGIAPADTQKYAQTNLIVSQTSTGFSITARDVSPSYEESVCSNRTISYVAVKYT